MRNMNYQIYCALIHKFKHYNIMIINTHKRGILDNENKKKIRRIDSSVIDLVFLLKYQKDRIIEKFTNQMKY